LVIADVAEIADASISFDGVDYVVVWAEAPAFLGAWTIRLQRIATDGTLSGESVTLGSVDNPNTGSLEVASRPDSDLVVWCAGAIGSEACFWVQVEGTTVVASDSMPIDGTITGLAASGDAWLIVTQASDHEISLIRVGSDGLALDDAPTPLANGNFPALAPAETGWVVIWAGAQPMFAQISPGGSVAVGPAPLPGVQTMDGRSIVRTSEGFVITGLDTGSIVASVFGQDLSQPPDTVTVATGSVHTLGRAKAVWGGSSLLLNWGDYLVSSGIRGSFAKRLSSEGAVLDESEISIGLRPNSQSAPAAAHGPDGWLVAWQDNSPYDSWDIYAQRLDEQGIPSSQDSILLAGGEGAEETPAVAGSPAGWLIAWRNEGRIEAVRVDPSGDVLDEVPIEIGISLSAPTVVFDGTHWIVGWVSTAPGDTPYLGGTARIVRIGASGAFVDPESIKLSNSVSMNTSLDIDVDDTGYQVSYSSSEDGPAGFIHVSFGGVWEQSTALEHTYGPGHKSHELEYRDGSGWLFWGDEFQSLGSNLPTQSVEPDYGFDLASIGQQGLAAWYSGGDLQLGLASMGGPLESKAEIAGRTTSPHLAVKSSDTALLSYAMSEQSPSATNRVFVRFLNVSGSEDGEGGAAGAPSEAGGAPSTGGTSGHASGGTADGGAPEEGGAPSGRAGEGSTEPENGGEAGRASDGEAGRASGGSASNGDDPSKSEDDRYVSCACRVGSQTKGTVAPWLALLLGFMLRARRRQRSPG
jgi:MYXO-CTERM domain-containing protein